MGRFGMLPPFAGVAQTVEQLTRNEQAKGSSPFSGSKGFTRRFRRRPGGSGSRRADMGAARMPRCNCRPSPRQGGRPWPGSRSVKHDATMSQSSSAPASRFTTTGCSRESGTGVTQTATSTEPTSCSVAACASVGTRSTSCPPAPPSTVCTRGRARRRIACPTRFRVSCRSREVLSTSSSRATFPQRAASRRDSTAIRVSFPRP